MNVRLEILNLSLFFHYCLQTSSKIKKKAKKINHSQTLILSQVLLHFSLTFSYTF